jgi:hypothetical protein
MRAEVGSRCAPAACAPAYAVAVTYAHGLIVVGVFLAIVFGFVIVSARRRGGWYLHELRPLDGEATLLEVDLEFAATSPRTALAAYQLLSFVRGRVRVTNFRVVVAQPVLFRKHLHAMSHMIHFRRDTCEGGPVLYVVSVLDRAKSGRGPNQKRPELRLYTEASDLGAPEFIAFRGERVADLARSLSLPFGEEQR